MSLGAFYLTLSRFLATIRCGHSYANFFNQKQAVQAALFDSPDKLPLGFRWLGNQMVVTADPFGTGIVPGSEVLSLNGRPAGAVLARLMTVARADGANDAKRRALMSVTGQSYESFDVFSALFFGSRPVHDLIVEAPDGKRRRASIPSVSLAQRRGQGSSAAKPDPATPLWTMTRPRGAALLTMPAWALYNSKWDWSAWIDAEMDGLVADAVPHLVIDLRGNEGGVDCGQRIVARLIDSPVESSPFERRVRYRRVPEDLRPYCDTWDRSFDDWSAGAVEYDARYFQFRRKEEADQAIQPAGPRFRGRVTVLIDSGNSSATFQFAELLQRQRLARLVGEPTGGNRRGINGGAFYFLRLPQTGLEVDLPLIGYFHPRPQPDAGIVPDRIVPVTRASIARGEDPVLAEVLA